MSILWLKHDACFQFETIFINILLKVALAIFIIQVKEISNIKNKKKKKTEEETNTQTNTQNKMISDKILNLEIVFALH